MTCTPPALRALRARRRRVSSSTPHRPRHRLRRRSHPPGSFPSDATRDARGHGALDYLVWIGGLVTMAAVIASAFANPDGTLASQLAKRLQGLLSFSSDSDRTETLPPFETNALDSAAHLGDESEFAWVQRVDGTGRAVFRVATGDLSSLSSSWKLADPKAVAAARHIDLSLAEPAEGRDLLASLGAIHGADNVHLAALGNDPIPGGGPASSLAVRRVPTEEDYREPATPRPKVPTDLSPDEWPQDLLDKARRVWSEAVVEERALDTLDSAIDALSLSAEDKEAYQTVLREAGLYELSEDTGAWVFRRRGIDRFLALVQSDQGEAAARENAREQLIQLSEEFAPKVAGRLTDVGIDARPTETSFGTRALTLEGIPEELTAAISDALGERGPAKVVIDPFSIPAEGDTMSIGPDALATTLLGYGVPLKSDLIRFRNRTVAFDEMPTDAYLGRVVIPFAKSDADSILEFEFADVDVGIEQARLQLDELARAKENKTLGKALDLRAIQALFPPEPLSDPTKQSSAVINVYERARRRFLERPAAAIPGAELSGTTRDGSVGGLIYSDGAMALLTQTQQGYQVEIALGDDPRKQPSIRLPLTGVSEEEIDWVRSADWDGTMPFAAERIAALLDRYRADLEEYERIRPKLYELTNELRLYEP